MVYSFPHKCICYAKGWQITWWGKVSQRSIWPLVKIVKLTHSENIYSGFYLTVNNLMKDEMQKVFSLMNEHSGFIKFTLNALD